MSWCVTKAEYRRYVYTSEGLVRGEKVIRKLLFVLAICFLITMPSLADIHGDGYSGGIANFTRLSGYYSHYWPASGGGEFTLYGDGLTLSNDAYHSYTSDFPGYSNSFQTFCLERDEYVSSANIWVSTQNAALTGFGSHAYLGGNNTDSGDDLDSRTAYLYYQFATGALSGYDYNNSGYGREYSAGQLQKAIWYIEEEMDNLWSGNTLAWAWIQEAENATNWSGIGDVRVLQMNIDAECGCSYKQDFIYLQPVPTPAAVILGVLGMVIAGVKLRKFT